MIEGLKEIAATLYGRIQRHKASGRTLTLKVKFSDYQQITRSHTFEEPIDTLDKITTEGMRLLELVDPEGKSVRLLGLSLSNLVCHKQIQATQLSLF